MNGVKDAAEWTEEGASEQSDRRKIRCRGAAYLIGWNGVSEDRLTETERSKISVYTIARKERTGKQICRVLGCVSGVIFMVKRKVLKE